MGCAAGILRRVAIRFRCRLISISISIDFDFDFDFDSISISISIRFDPTRSGSIRIRFDPIPFYPIPFYLPAVAPALHGKLNELESIELVRPAVQQQRRV